MSKKKTGWPFQEGYLSGSDDDIHIFTDYRWDDGSVTRCWHIDKKPVNLKSVSIRPFSLEDDKIPDQ